MGIDLSVVLQACRVSGVHNDVSCGVQALAELLYGWARLDYLPGDQVMDRCITLMFQKLSQLRSGQLADILWALAVLDSPPGAA